MKKYQILLFISVLCNFSFGQQSKIDSIKIENSNYFESKNKNFNTDTISVNHHIEISNLYQKINADSSILYVNKAIELSKNIKWKLGESKSLFEKGRYHQNLLYDYHKAIDFYRKSIDILIELYPKEKGGNLAALYYNYLSIAFSSIEENSKAIETIMLMLEITEQLKYLDLQINVYNSLGNLYRKTKQNDSAIIFFSKGLSIANELNSTVKIPILVGNIAMSYANIGKYDVAIEHYNKAFELDSIANNKYGQIRHLINLGSVFRLRGDLNKSIDVYRKSITLGKEVNYKEGLANAYSSSAIIYNIKGDYSKALLNNQQALDLYVKMNNVYSQSITLGNMGLDYQFSGNIPKAFECFNKSIKLIKEYDLPASGSEEANIALIYEEHGSYEHSLELHFKSLELFKKNKNYEGQALCFGNIGNVYFRMGDNDKSYEYQNKSFEIADTLGLKLTVANALSSIGSIYVSQKKYDQALEYFKEAYLVYDTMNATINLSNSSTSISSIYTDLKEYDKALFYGELAFKHASEIGNPASIRAASKIMYRYYNAIGDFNNAMKYLSILRQTINEGIEYNYLSFSERERENYFKSIEEDLWHYIDFGVSQHENFPNISDTLYNLAVSNKGLSLKSSTLIRQSIINSGDSILIEDYSNLLSLKKMLFDNLSKGVSIEEIELEIAELESSLIKRSSAFNDFNKVKNLDWKLVQKGLKSDEAAIEFINYKTLADSTHSMLYAALIIKKDSKHPIVVKLCEENEIENILGVFQGNNMTFVKNVYGTKKKTEKALYNLIWKPLETELKDIKKIYYSPSGLLHKISFASISNSDNTFLCDNYNLNQKVSTGNLVFKNEVYYDSKDEFLIIGGVNYSIGKSENNVWSYLPGTLKETQNIHAFLTEKKHKVNYFSANSATESNFKELAKEANILHVSTHGFFFPDPDQTSSEFEKQESVYDGDIEFRGTSLNDSLNRSNSTYAYWNFVLNKNPLMRSGLVLSGANDVWQRNDSIDSEDGILTSQEVSNIDLNNCKLVVLSACETGLGDIKGSEGVFGLQRAFKIAGANYLIMSLWQVPDKETAEFMELFYKNLIKVKDITKAFNMTQKSMRKKYDPFFWGAFVLVK